MLKKGVPSAMAKAKLQKKALKWSAIIAKRLDFILLRRKNFCIISNNCWGSRLYEILKREYNTPFVGLFLRPTHYINFIKNLEKNISIELTIHHFKNTDEKYPVANIEGCDIYFLHYENKSEAIMKWNRRRIRLLNHIEHYGMDKIIFKYCDSFLSDNEESLLKEFNSLTFKNKISFNPDMENKFLNINKNIINGDELFRGRLLYYRKYIELFSEAPPFKIKHVKTK